ncbi:MAG: murein biosynthesis integral membrane protein MurJ [Desulfohalobiaceae bacterium]|nr:murein biosynthesis integral membrane protein MurJ [Desulfohalobiaceae bacterium]
MATKSIVEKIARNASVVAGATLLSRVLGFLRDVIIAFALGAGPLGDAFFVAFRIPNLLRRLFAEGSLTMAFVPVFTRTRLEQGLSPAFTLARSTRLWLLLVLGLITLIVLPAAGPLTYLIAPGLSRHAPTFELTVSLVRICFPYIIFISLVALCMGILNSLDHFLAPALAPCILNLVLISSALYAVGTGSSVPFALAVGVLIAGFGQYLLQLPFLKKQGFSWKGPAPVNNQNLKKVAWLMLPSVVGAAVYQLNIVLNTILASFLAQGSISFLYYADRLVQFPLGIFGVAISTAALPGLAGLAASGKKREFLSTLDQTISLTLFISLPATAGLIGLNDPLVQTLFSRGAFGLQAAQGTSLALIGYSLGLPAFCSIRSMVSAFYAQEDIRTPVKIAIVCLLLNLCLGLLLMQPLAHTGLALAVSLSSWANVVLLGLCLRRKSGAWFSWDKNILIMTLSSLVIGGGSFLTADWGWAALLLIPAWAGLYYLIASCFQLPETRMITRMIGSLAGRRP